MNTEDRVKRVLQDLCGQETIEMNASLQSDLALDSLLMVTMLVKIEEEFNIELKETDMNPFDLTNVQSVVNMIKKYTNGEEDEKES